MSRSNNVVVVYAGDSIEINKGKEAFVRHTYRQTMYLL